MMAPAPSFGERREDTDDALGGGSGGGGERLARTRGSSARYRARGRGPGKLLLGPNENMSEVVERRAPPLGRFIPLSDGSPPPARSQVGPRARGWRAGRGGSRAGATSAADLQLAASAAGARG